MYSTTPIKNGKAIEISVVGMGDFDRIEGWPESGFLLCHITQPPCGNTDYCVPMTFENAKNLHENLGAMLNILECRKEAV